VAYTEGKSSKAYEKVIIKTVNVFYIIGIMYSDYHYSNCADIGRSELSKLKLDYVTA
jgi:hypothetical protein